MDVAFGDIAACWIAACLIAGAFWLATHVSDRWLFRFESDCFEAMDSFWAPVLDAYHGHIAAKAKRLSARQKDGER